MRFSKFDVCCFFFVLFSPLQVAKFKVTAADNQTAFLHAICIFLCLSVCLSVSLLATVLQFKSLFILLSSRQDENGKNHFHSRFELFGAENICSRRGAEFSCIFRVCRWMLFPSFYTTAGHNCPPSHAHHPQTTKASNFICGRNCFGPYDPPSRPALAHCSSDALSALATWQIESKMQQPLFLVPFAGLSSSRFSSFLFYFSLDCKTKPMQPVLSTAFSSNDQPPSSLGKCSSSQPCRLSYFAASRHVDFLTAQ